MAKHEKKSERYVFIDFIKAIGIMLVILGHINFANQGIKAWIYSFHMPVFFFASGLLLKNNGLETTGDLLIFLKKKANALLIPYFLWAIIYASLSIKNLLKILYGSYRMISGAGALSSLWFLLDLFIAFCLYAITRYVLKNRLNSIVKILLILCAFLVSELLPRVSIGYPWGLNVGFAAFGFLLLGNLCFPIICDFRRFVSQKKAGILISAILACIFLAGTFLYKMNIPEQGNILMANAVYGNIVFFVLTSVCGIMFVVCVSILLELCLPAFWESKLTFVGKNTLCIFAVQKPIIAVFKKLFGFVQIPDVAVLIASFICTLICSCIICIPINKYMPLLSGRKKTGNSDPISMG